VCLGSAPSRFEDDNGREQLSESDGGCNINGGYTEKIAVTQSLPVVTLWHLRQKIGLLAAAPSAPTLRSTFLTGPPSPTFYYCACVRTVVQSPLQSPLQSPRKLPHLRPVRSNLRWTQSFHRSVRSWSDHVMLYLIANQCRQSRTRPLHRTLEGIGSTTRLSRTSDESLLFFIIVIPFPLRYIEIKRQCWRPELILTTRHAYTATCPLLQLHTCLTVAVFKQILIHIIWREKGFILNNPFPLRWNWLARSWMSKLYAQGTSQWQWACLASLVQKGGSCTVMLYMVRAAKLPIKK